MKQKKILLVVLACMAGVSLLVGGACLLLDKKEPVPTDYTELNREESIVFDGKEYIYNEHLSNYLFMGVDTKDPITQHETHGQAGQADAIYVISYDRVKNTAKCIAIPRDTMTSIHVFAPDGTDLDYTVNHINLQYAYGDGKTESCELMKEAVQKLLLGVPIQGYCAINIEGIPILADVAGGVQVTVPDDSLEEVNPIFRQGATVVLDKDTAEIFVRYRDVNERQSANVRMQRQKVFMEAFADTAKAQWGQDTNFIATMDESLKPYMVSNIGNDVLAKLLQADYGEGEIFRDIPGEKVNGEEFDEYRVNNDELYELILQMFYKEVKKA